MCIGKYANFLQAKENMGQHLVFFFFNLNFSIRIQNLTQDDCTVMV